MTTTAIVATTAIARKLEAIQSKGALRASDIANLLETRPETVSRWKQGKAFPQSNTERQLLDLEYIVDQLSDFYEPQEARLWLFSRQRALQGERPADLIQQGRTAEVIGIIDQLRDGVYV
jgi:uncharacterized protein (DUF2384 family)